MAEPRQRATQLAKAGPQQRAAALRKMIVELSAPGTSVKEFVIIELQGELQARRGEALEAQTLGVLKFKNVRRRMPRPGASQAGTRHARKATAQRTSHWGGGLRRRPYPSHLCVFGCGAPVSRGDPLLGARADGELAPGLTHCGAARKHFARAWPRASPCVLPSRRASPR